MRTRIHGYARADFEDAWSRYLPGATGTSGTSDTAAATVDSAPVRTVPDVPDVPVAQDSEEDPAIEVARMIWQVFGDDAEYVVGTA